MHFSVRNLIFPVHAQLRSFEYTCVQLKRHGTAGGGRAVATQIDL
jgi:hypothetical protein